MTIHRSQPTSAAASMPGDFVVLASATGARYALAQLAPAVHMFGPGLFGKIARQGDDIVLVPDDRLPDLVRSLGPVILSNVALIERVSVDREHEKAILGLQYLRRLSDAARERARGQDGVVQGQLLAQLMGEGANSDLRRIADELTAAGIQVVEKKQVTTVETTTIFLTADPEAVREGRQVADTMKFATAPKESKAETVEIFDAFRTRELLLSTQPVQEVADLPQAVQPAAPALQPAETNIMNLLGLHGLLPGGTLTADDIGLGEDFPPDEDHPEGPGMR